MGSLLKHSELWSGMQGSMESFRGNVMIRIKRRMHTQLYWIENERDEGPGEGGAGHLQSVSQVLGVD